MEKYSDNSVGESVYFDAIICEISNQFMADMEELFENDDFYEEVMNIENILKKEGF